MEDSLTPMALSRILVLGLYVLGGELHWVVKKAVARLSGGKGRDALNIWRKNQIDRRRQRFSLS